MNRTCKILISLFLICISTFAQKGATLNISYFDCYTGKKIIPNNVLARKLTSLNQIEKVKNVSNKEQLVFFESGNYNLEIDLNDYKTQITNIPIFENVPTKYEFFLQPLKKDSRLETSSILSKLQDGKMFINGFISTDVGQSIENCEIEVTSKGEKVLTDKDGYFEITFPLTNNEEEFIDFRVSKLGFETKLYTHVLCWKKGDWQYQIRLKKGNDQKVPLIIPSQTGNEHIQGSEDLLDRVLQSNPINKPSNTDAFNNCIPNSIKVGFSLNGTNCCPGGKAGFPSCEIYQVFQLDNYVERVIPNEWPANWNNLPNIIEAYKAAAIAVRSYSINRIIIPVKGYRNLYDICSSPCCQNFGASNAQTSAGVSQTTGMVLIYNNEVPLSLYSAENNHLTPQCISGSTIINEKCSNGQFSLDGSCYSDPVSINKQIAGHGEGMSQRGSARWASGKSLGNCSNSISNLPNTGYPTKNYTQILNQYYPTYSISNFSSCTNTSPPNDNCSVAESIISNGVCKTGTVAGATGSYGANQCIGCSCKSPDDNDVYYSFLAVSTTHSVTISNYASDFDAVIELRTACSTGTAISCYDPSGTPSTVSRTWTGLTIGETYYIRVFEFNSTGTPPSSSSFTICVTHSAPCTPPSTPTASSPTSPTTTSFTAHWNSIVGVTSYLLDVSLSSNFSSYLTGYQGLETTNLSVIVSGLSCGSTYYYRVRAKNNCESSNSSIITAITSACNSGTPLNDNCSGATLLTFSAFYFPVYYSNIGATASGFASCEGTQDDDVFFKFVPNTNFASITVESRINFDAVFQVLAGSCGGTMTELACVDDTGIGGVENITLTGLTVGATYYIRVWHYGIGTSSNGDFYISAYGNCISPPAPTLSSPSNITSTSFQANWNAINNVAYYSLEVSAYSDFRSLLPNYSNLNVGNTTGYNIVGLSCNTTYYYRISGYKSCPSGNFIGSSTGSMSATTSSNCCSLPSAPTSSSASNVSNTSFTANWSQIANIEYYRIDISTNQNFTTYISGYQDFIIGNGNTSYTLNGLNCGTLYYYRIKAVSNNCGTSSNSNVTSVTTSNITPTSNFQANTATTINIGETVQFQSNATQNPDSYIWAFDGGTPSSSTSVIPLIQYNIAGVYNVSFQAHNACGWGNTNTSTNFITVINCIDNPILSTYYNGNIVQIKAPNTITANNRINSGANILYQAGKTIVLNAGFVVEQGGIFKAQMGGCNN